MKKIYITPRVEIINLQTISVLAASPSTSYEVNGGGSKGPSGNITTDYGEDESDVRHKGFGNPLWED